MGGCARTDVQCSRTTRKISQITSRMYCRKEQKKIEVAQNFLAVKKQSGVKSKAVEEVVKYECEKQRWKISKSGEKKKERKEWRKIKESLATGTGWKQVQPHFKPPKVKKGEGW